MEQELSLLGTSTGTNVIAGTNFAVSSAGAITAPTSTNTINNLVISSGALSSVTGITFSSGNFDQSASAGTFKTGTSAVSLNGDTTIASGKTLTLTGFSQGSVLYTNGTAVVTGATGTSNQVLHGGTTPTFSAVDLTADVTGILPITNGGSPFNFCQWLYL